MKNVMIILSFCCLGGIPLFAQSDIKPLMDRFFNDYIKEGKVDYQKIKNDQVIQELVDAIAEYDIDKIDGDVRLSFLLNAYNIYVIDGVVASYPTKSVADIPRFFDDKRYKLGGKMVSLDYLEKSIILNEYKDARLHFALVCGALGCPRLSIKPYVSKMLNEQLDAATRDALKLENSLIITDQSHVSISKIFDWYSSDFGGRDGIIAFINNYSDYDIGQMEIGYIPYDWSLNETVEFVGATETFIKPNNAFRYISSSTAPVGQVELKVFNNLYSQQGEGNRSSYFTMINSFLYGWKDNFNVGFDLRYRRVHNDVDSRSAFAVLGRIKDHGRQRITTIGPKIRWAPFPEKFENFSIQSALWFTTADDLEFGANNSFIDWDSPVFFTQLFNDKSIGDYFSLFTELDIMLEDIGRGDTNRFSTPVTGILSYFPTPQWTWYALAGYSPFWQKEYDYFYQIGSGLKYQMSSQLEFELLITHFSNKYLASVDGGAATYNFGIRYSSW